MGKIGLQVCANLVSNVDILSCKKPEFVWLVMIECRNCHETSSSWQSISQDEQLAVAGGRGTANYVAKCKLCKSEIKISIMCEYLADYTLENSEQYKTVVGFECRGGEPVKYMFGDDWTVKSTNGNKYDNVDLTEDSGDWVFYEEETKSVLEISNAEYKFVKID